MPGILTVAATPIGNVADASPRLVAALADADLIAAEDTRRLYRMATMLGLTLNARVISFFEGNEEDRGPELIDELQAGRSVLLVSDAGTPTLSDPGYRLVAMCAELEIPVTALPGPSAITTALAVAGLPTGRFTFEGFLPRRSGERRTRLTELAGESRTMVFFESPRRVAATLSDMAEVFSADRAACVCRELTKTYEEVRRGSLDELADWAQGDVLGEVTIVVAGTVTPAPVDDPEGWRSAVAEHVAAGMSRRDAIDEVAQLTGAARKSIYRAVHDVM